MSSIEDNFFQLADVATEDASKVTTEHIATTKALEKEKSVFLF